MIQSNYYNISITENYSNGIVNKIFLENYVAKVKDNYLQIQRTVYKDRKERWESGYNSEIQCMLRIPLHLVDEAYYEDMTDTRILWLEQECVCITIKLEKKEMLSSKGCRPQIAFLNTKLSNALQEV